MKKILLTTNFSKASENAIAYALNLFGDSECEFTIMYASDNNPVGSPEVDFSLIEEMYNRSKKEAILLTEKIKKEDNKKFHTFKTEVIPTSPASAINILNRTNKYDFVVVGATGKGNDILFGTTATDVVRKDQVNTIVVPEKAKILPIKNVVLAVDYLPISSFNDFDGLKEILHRKDCTLTLLNILDDEQHPNDSYTKAQYDNYFKDIKTIEYYIRENTAEEGIIEYLEYHKTDLLVMLTRHHSFFDLLFNRSVTRKFAFNPTLPLMSIFCNEVEVPNEEIIVA
jgi:nucleotide-binding universal stress UspA family protein